METTYKSTALRQIPCGIGFTETVILYPVLLIGTVKNILKPWLSKEELLLQAESLQQVHLSFMARDGFISRPAES